MFIALAMIIDRTRTLLINIMYVVPEAMNTELKTIISWSPFNPSQNLDLGTSAKLTVLKCQKMALWMPIQQNETNTPLKWWITCLLMHLPLLGGF